MSQESITLSEDQINSLREKYEIPEGLIDPEIANVLHTLYQYEHGESETLPDRLHTFQKVADEILSSQLSKNNMQLLYEVCNGALGLYSHPQSILHDAKELFKIHVGSVIKDTIKSLHHGSALEKLGATLSLPGKALDGISIFWDELAKKHAILKVIDLCVVKPLLINFYSTMGPELVIIKACEFAGRAMIERAKTGEWKSSIFSAASTMADSATKHFERLLGTSYQATLIDSIAAKSGLGAKQKETLKTLVGTDDNFAMIIQSIQNPKTAAASVAGALVVSKMTGVEIKDSLKIMQEILYSEKKKETKINIEDFCKGADPSDKIAQNLAKVFGTDAGGHLPRIPKSLSDIIEATQNSTKIEDNIKSSLIQFFVAYAVKNEVNKMQAKDQGQDQSSSSHAKKEEIRRDSKAAGTEQGEQGRSTS